MSRRKIILICSGAATLTISAFVLLFGIQIFYVYQARSWGKQFPFVWQTPVELNDTAEAQTGRATFSYFGYRFDAPWSDFDSSRASTRESIQLIPFRSGKAILFSAFPANTMTDGFNKFLMEHAAEIPPEKVVKLRRALRPTLDSDYDLESAILETTPRSLRIFTSPGNDMLKFILLMLKGPSFSDDARIFKMNASCTPGFQFGDPKAGPKRIEVKLYRPEAQLRFVFIHRPGVSVTQPEINFVIRSVRRGIQ